MQGVNVTWAGQKTSLPRCNVSKEKKSRTRLTKEERRTMAVSFIKKYQSTNNGKFPSLNLTHKEVGGSFYTIREIVREIIQENKVLGPGNPSSKLLNLEYCLEEEVDKGSLLDVHGNMSSSKIGLGMDHYEVDSLVTERKCSSEENTAIIKPFFQVMFPTLLNNNSPLQVMHAEYVLQEDSPNGVVLHAKLVNTLKESDVHTSTLKNDSIPGGAEQVNDEVQLNSSEDVGIHYILQSILLDHSAPRTTLVESEVKNVEAKSKIPGETQFFEERTNISDTAITESLPGTTMSFSNTVNDQVNCSLKQYNGRDLLLVSENFAQDSSSESAVFDASSTTQIPRTDDKVHFPSDPFENGTVIVKLSDTEALTSSDITEKAPCFANTGDDKEPTKNGSQVKGNPSSIEGDIIVAEAKTVDSFFSRTLRSFELGTIENDIQWADNCNSFTDAIKESKVSSSQLLEPNIQERNHSEIQAEKLSDDFFTNVGGLVSSSDEMASKESQKFEMDQMWAEIKKFISYFIKFWSE